MRTCAPLVLLGLCPKPKYPPLCGGIFIERGTKFVLMRECEREVIRLARVARYEQRTDVARGKLCFKRRK